MDKKVQKLIKKYKYIVYILVGALGVGAILLTQYYPMSRSPNIYNILMGIGCSVVATVIVTMILLVLIPDDSDTKTDLDNWGIIKIYDERDSIKISSKHFPKNKLDYVAFGLSHFREENKRSEVLVSCLLNGLNIRILTLNPYSIYVKEQEKIENSSGDISNDIINLIRWVEKSSNLAKQKSHYRAIKGSINIKLYNSLPLNFYCQADDDIYIGPYLPDISSGKTITYQFSAHSTGGKYYSDIFEKIWSEDSSIRIGNDYHSYFSINQKDSIEAVMEYFCEIFKGNNAKQVIGVVAIFRERLRRTFFSCNKQHAERHVCHRREEGAVGQLVLLNSNNSQRSLFLVTMRIKWLLHVLTKIEIIILRKLKVQ